MGLISRSRTFNCRIDPAGGNEGAFTMRRHGTAFSVVGSGPSAYPRPAPGATPDPTLSHGLQRKDLPGVAVRQAHQSSLRNSSTVRPACLMIEARTARLMSVA